MNFKKYNEMELALLGAIAAMSEEEAESISMEKGDIDFASMEEYTSVPSYLSKPSSAHHALRRKATFHKKEEWKNLAQNLGYIMDTNNSKKVKSMLAASHSDNAYFKGYKVESKHTTVKEEISMMEQENREIARDAMEEEHDSILGAIACDIDTLTLDMESNEHHIEDLEADYNELEEAMKLVSEKLENAKLRRNGIQAALAQKKDEYEKMCNKLLQEVHRFGW